MRGGAVNRCPRLVQCTVLQPSNCLDKAVFQLLHKLSVPPQVGFVLSASCCAVKVTERLSAVIAVRMWLSYGGSGMLAHLLRMLS